MNIEEELRKLRIEEQKAENLKDYDLAISLKRKRLNKELELLDSITNTKKSLFNPKKHNEINSLKMEVVGRNYIPLIKGGYNILVGRGGVGKSAIALKSMLMWLNDNPTKNAMAYFTEDSIEEVIKRSHLICNNSNLPHDLVDRVYFIALNNDDRIKWVSLSKEGYNIKEDYISDMINFCKQNKIEFVILDPLKRFHSLSENSNDDMDILVRDCFTRVAVDTNSVFLVLHHSAKSGDGAGRGASTITDTARISWRVSKFYTKDNLTGETKVIEEKKDKIKLTAVKDNNGIERDCIIRAKHDDSIDNPLSRNYGYDEVIFNSGNEFINDIA